MDHYYTCFQGYSAQSKKSARDAEELFKEMLEHLQTLEFSLKSMRDVLLRRGDQIWMDENRLSMVDYIEELLEMGRAQ